MNESLDELEGLNWGEPDQRGVISRQCGRVVLEEVELQPLAGADRGVDVTQRNVALCVDIGKVLRKCQWWQAKLLTK